MEVKPLYTSIPNHEGIVAVKKRYEKYTNSTIPPKPKIIAKILALNLTLNNFIFNSNFYLKQKDYSMGTICGPA